MPKRISILISGRVQGVMFRRSAKTIASKLGIFGFAENLLDGKVRIVAEGKEESLKKMLDFASSGNFMSKVESVFFEWSTAKNEFKEFTVIREKNNLVSDQIQAFQNLGRNLFHKNEEVDMTKLQLPKHVVIIPDGNRRWAKAQGKNSFEGHRSGAQRVRELISFLQNTSVESLTVWAFSTENWKRDESEVKYLMQIFNSLVDEMEEICLRDKIIFRHLGRKNILDAKIVERLNSLEEKTANFQNAKNLNLALDYGGRDEILRAVNKLEKTDAGISEEDFTKALDTKNISDPDLIIRTSGEKRLSGILPWQSVYSELYFTDKHFPDFGIPEFKLALQDYSNRMRRFGK